MQWSRPIGAPPILGFGHVVSQSITDSCIVFPYITPMKILQQDKACISFTCLQHIPL